MNSGPLPCLSVCLSECVCVSVCLSVCLSVGLSASLHAYAHVRVSTCAQVLTAASNLPQTDLQQCEAQTAGLEERLRVALCQHAALEEEHAPCALRIIELETEVTELLGQLEEALALGGRASGLQVCA